MDAAQRSSGESRSDDDDTDKSTLDTALDMPQRTARGR
jgi:hypothetical protein